MSARRGGGPVSNEDPLDKLEDYARYNDPEVKVDYANGPNDGTGRIILSSSRGSQTFSFTDNNVKQVVDGIINSWKSQPFAKKGVKKGKKNKTDKKDNGGGGSSSQHV